MGDQLLRFVVRTPHEVVLDAQVRSARVLTETGHVGLRARTEPLALAVEAGLALLGIGGRVRFVGTAGGVLSCDGAQATLFTPLAVAGDDAPSVEAALDRALAAPGAEQQLRAALDRMEGRILTELRRHSGTDRPLRGEDA
jgi:F0F1-type ATP synthase epsilon subunit